MKLFVKVSGELGGEEERRLVTRLASGQRVSSVAADLSDVRAGVCVCGFSVYMCVCVAWPGGGLKAGHI